MLFNRFTAALLLGASAAAFSAPAAAQTRPQYGLWGVDYASMDKSVRPGDDFFGYAQGSWLKTEIPADKSRIGYNFDLPDEIEVELRAMVDGAGAAPADPTMRQVADFYAAYLDEAGIEARGTAPLKPYLARIAGIGSRHDLLMLMTEAGYASPIDIDIDIDEKDPKQYTVGVSQANLGLPTRDYYLLDGEQYVAYRKAYRDYIIKLHELAGIPDGAAKADAIIALETSLARDQWTPVQLRDPQATFNPMTRAQLDTLAPQFEWNATLEHGGLGKMPIVVVRSPSAIAAAGKWLDDVPLSTWKDYLAFRFISSHSAYLPRAFDDATFGFYGRTLFGAQTKSDRWKRGIRQLNGHLGEAVGKLYADRHWSPEAARQINELVEDMRAAFGEKIGEASWMDAATRKEALTKLAGFEARMGHPDKYIDYSSMPVSRTDPLANSVASGEFQQKLALSRLGKPVDRTLWGLNVHEVNASYSPVKNQITFPAAQLMPPFFDPAADPAVNYGAIGSTIGHEMGHGFDDEGRQYDGTGRLRDWWTKDSADRYNARVDVLAKQFDAYEPIPGVHINGRLTLGENLGDLGGLEAAYAAYRRYVARHGEPPVIDGYTGDQRFFISYAQNWQGKAREGTTRSQLLSDPHAPEAYRVNGIVRNMDAWYAAFGIKPGDKLYLAPAERVKVW